VATAEIQQEPWARGSGEVMPREPQIARLADGRRLHLQDGPIDLIIETFGTPFAVEAAYDAACSRFYGLLDELCAELPELRARASANGTALNGAIARRMWAAVAPFAGEMFITPMAAVAGAVAEEMLGVMVAAAPLAKAYVNNGGDIALMLAPGSSLRAGLVAFSGVRTPKAELLARTVINAADGIGGIATSGWRGRSFSLGIADSVTVLARTAAMADAAATVVANAVDLPGHGAIIRQRARDLQPDSDLGDLAVTRGVGELLTEEIDEALARGMAEAGRLRERGLITAAALALQDEMRFEGSLALVSDAIGAVAALP
jgi:uncharacterized protein